MGMFTNFFDNMSLGIGYAFDSLVADVEYNTSMKSFERETERRRKQLNKRAEKEKANQEWINENHPLGLSINEDGVLYITEPYLKEKEEASEKEVKRVNDVLKGTELAVIDDIVVQNPDPVLTKMSHNKLLEHLDAVAAALPGIDSRKAKLVSLTLLYAACLINRDQVYKELDIDHYDQDLALINSVYKTLCGAEFDYRYQIPKITEVIYNLDELKKICEYEALTYKNNQALEECWAKAISLAAANADKVVQAVTINNSNVIEPDHAEPMTADELLALNNEFGTSLANRYYEFHKLGWMYEIVFVNKLTMHTESYIIDPGFIFGAGTSLIVVDGTTIYPVPVSDHQLITRLLDYPQGGLTDDEKKQIDASLFNDFRIYSNIDMSRGHQILPTLTKKNKEELQRKLTAIMNLPWGCNDRPNMPRLRIKTWKSVNEFTLVSDNKVKVPSLSGFNGLVVKDFKIEVKGNKCAIFWDGRAARADLNKKVPAVA